ACRARQVPNPRPVTLPRLALAQTRSLPNERAYRRIGCRSAQRPALLCLEELPDHIAGYTLFAELAHRCHRPPTDAGWGWRELPSHDQSAAALAEVDLRLGRLCGLAPRSRPDAPDHCCELRQRTRGGAASAVP